MKPIQSYETAVTEAIAQLQAKSDARMARRQRMNTDSRVIFLRNVRAENTTQITESGFAGLDQMAAGWGSPRYFRRQRASQLLLIRRVMLDQGFSYTAKDVLSYCAELRREEKAALAERAKPLSEVAA